MNESMQQQLQMATMRASTIAATRLHVSLEIYKVLLEGWIEEPAAADFDQAKEVEGLQQAAIQHADGLLKKLGLVP